MTCKLRHQRACDFKGPLSATQNIKHKTALRPDARKANKGTAKAGARTACSPRWPHPWPCGRGTSVPHRDPAEGSTRAKRPVPHSMPAATASCRWCRKSSQADSFRQGLDLLTGFRHTWVPCATAHAPDSEASVASRSTVSGLAGCCPILRIPELM